MAVTRNNHYVPQWYQKGFLGIDNKLHYLDLKPEQKILPDGRVINFNERRKEPTSKCFFETDLYTTVFGPFISDIIEKKYFGKIDDEGCRAVRAFIEDNPVDRHERFMDFFNFIDTQKIRTPKGLDWLKAQYSGLDQLSLMREMEAIQQMHCTIWTEGVREIISAGNSNIKFIVSDHPVTVFNYACPFDSDRCRYPDDPPIALKASQTIFALDKNHCLILTNYEYAENPDIEDPLAKRTNARHFSNHMVRTDAMIRVRELDADEIKTINYVLKKRAKRYIAAEEVEWLYPEKDYDISWEKIRQTLLPPKNQIYHFGGEMFAGFKDGSTYYQDAFGRTSRENPYLKKPLPTKEPQPNDPCPCSQGKKYKKCCKNKPVSSRPAWDVLSIRERNIFFSRGVTEILGLHKGKTWDDVRRELSDDQVKEIHVLFGDLWPADTDINSLLPKPDGQLRAIYTGVIDPRVILIYAVSSTLYFDEVFIQNPFMNPAYLNPEYSPVMKPHQFKQQTLKNVMLLFMLEPFIITGSINFIPDLGVFNHHLRTESIDMAKSRVDKRDKNDGEEDFITDLHMDDYKRNMWTLEIPVKLTTLNRSKLTT